MHSVYLILRWLICYYHKLIFFDNFLIFSYILQWTMSCCIACDPYIMSIIKSIMLAGRTVYVLTFQAKVCYLLLVDVSIMRYKLTCL